MNLVLLSCFFLFSLASHRGVLLNVKLRENETEVNVIEQQIRANQHLLGGFIYPCFTIASNGTVIKNGIKDIGKLITELPSYPVIPLQSNDEFLNLLSNSSLFLKDAQKIFSRNHYYAGLMLDISAVSNSTIEQHVDKLSSFLLSLKKKIEEAKLLISFEHTDFRGTNKISDAVDLVAISHLPKNVSEFQTFIETNLQIFAPEKVSFSLSPGVNDSDVPAFNSSEILQQFRIIHQSKAIYLNVVVGNVMLQDYWWSYITQFIDFRPFSWWDLLNPGVLFILMTAVGTIGYSAQISLNFYEKLGLDEKEIEMTSTLKTKTVIVLPVFGSAVLILLFYFLDWLYYLLVVLITIVGFSSLLFLLSPLFQRIPVLRKEIKIVKYGITADTGVTVFISLSILLIWILTSHWSVVDIIGVSICISALTVIRASKLKVIAILEVGYMIFDVFWVFLSSFIFEKSVMIAVAQSVSSSSIRLPMLILFPRIFEDGYSMLGLGDIVLPGILICHVYQFECSLTNQKNESPNPLYCFYFRVAIIGYIIGLLVAYVMVLLLRDIWTGQPALLYLVPSTLIPIILSSYQNNHLNQMWNGVQLEREKAEDTEVLMEEMGENSEV